MGKHVLAIAHNAKLNELTKSQDTELNNLTVDETASPILTREGCTGISCVSSERKFIFDIEV